MHLAEHAEPFDNAPRIAFDETRWAVTYIGTEEGHFTTNAVRVDFNGGFLNLGSVPNVIDDTNDFSVNTSSPDGAWRGSRPVFAWIHTTAQQQSIAVGDAAGRNLIESAGAGIENRPRIAASLDGNTFLVTWLRGTDLIARINPDLATVPPPAVTAKRRPVAVRPGPPQLTPVASGVASYTLAWNGSAFEIVWQPRGDTSIMRTTVDALGRVNTSLLTHVDDSAALLEDSIDARTLVISSSGRLFWLIP